MHYGEIIGERKRERGGRERERKSRDALEKASRKDSKAAHVSLVELGRDAGKWQV